MALRLPVKALGKSRFFFFREQQQPPCSFIPEPVTYNHKIHAEIIYGPNINTLELYLLTNRVGAVLSGRFNDILKIGCSASSASAFLHKLLTNKNSNAMQLLETPRIISQPARNRANILVVDDEREICSILEDFLQEKYYVITRYSAEGGLEALEENRNGEDNNIELVITDLDLPKMSGMTLLNRIKKIYPEMGVVMISGAADSRTAINAIRMGAFDYVTKPFYEMDELEIIIQRWQKLQSLETKLKQYAKLHEDMMQHMKLRTFLSIDVKDSFALKQGADPFIAQHAFQEYHRFVKSCVQNHNGAIHSTAGDGVMACFTFTNEGLSAAEDLLRALPDFNVRLKSLRHDFRLRLGLHTGTAIVEDDGAINSMYSQTLDAAGHLQQNARVNSIELSEDAMLNLVDQSGFEELDKKVSGLKVYRREVPV